MKTSIITTLLLLLGLNCAASPATQLIRRMAKLQKYGVMTGHQDDPIYGHNWNLEKGRSDVKEVCGDYPAVMGFELGDLELGKAKNLDGVPFDRMRQEIKAQNRRGGIVEISWHPNNPVTGKNAWDTEGRPVGEILPGGKLCKEFAQRMKRVARFLASLRDDKGQPIPVIFRPWHEMGGGWFWWGKNSCTTEQYKQLYVYTYQFMKRQGLNNLVWGFSPNTGDARAQPVDRNGQETPKTHRPDRDWITEAANQKLVHYSALASHQALSHLLRALLAQCLGQCQRTLCAIRRAS